MAKIYLASSWRNPYQPSVLKALRDAGHEVYDFRNPPHGEGGFKWENVDEHWEEWTNKDYVRSLHHLAAEVGFKNDRDAMDWADCCVLLLPCGKSAHCEAGWMQGTGKPVFVLLTDKQEPELMYKLFTSICCTVEDLLWTLDFFACDLSLTHDEKSPFRKKGPYVIPRWTTYNPDEENKRKYKRVDSPLILSGTPALKHYHETGELPKDDLQRRVFETLIEEGLI